MYIVRSLALALSLWPGVALAQNTWDGNGNLNVNIGGRNGTGTAATTVTTTAPAILGFGTLAVTNSSALVSTATAGPNSAVWNATPPGAVYVLNDAASAGNLYVCPLGGTCSATVGLELAPGRSWGFYKPAATMTVFATTTATGQFQW